MSDIAKQKFKKEFKKWAQGKTIDEIADKAYEAVSTAYDLTKDEMIKLAFKHFVAKPSEGAK